MERQLASAALTKSRDAQKKEDSHLQEQQKQHLQLPLLLWFDTKDSLRRYRVTVEELSDDVATDSSSVDSIGGKEEHNNNADDLSLRSHGVKTVATTTVTMPSGLVDWLVRVTTQEDSFWQRLSGPGVVASSAAAGRLLQGGAQNQVTEEVAKGAPLKVMDADDGQSTNLVANDTAKTTSSESVDYSISAVKAGITSLNSNNHVGMQSKNDNPVLVYNAQKVEPPHIHGHLVNQQDQTDDSQSQRLQRQGAFTEESVSTSHGRARRTWPPGRHQREVRIV
jgi:hypothetical protein